MTNEEKKTPTIRDDNAYHVFRKEIGRISREENCDLGTAASKLTHKMGWGKEAAADRAEFDAYVVFLQKQTTEQDNRVKHYFGGE
jgi:hypothetical protein